MILLRLRKVLYLIILSINLISHGYFSFDDQMIHLPIDSLSNMLKSYSDGYQRLTTKAHSDYCKLKIANTFFQYMDAFAAESAFPFEDVMFQSECNNSAPSTLFPLRTKSLKPTPNNSYPSPLADIPLNASTVSILYVMLVHEQPELLERLLHALNESQHTFVIHIDAKADTVYDVVCNLSLKFNNVFVIHENREIMSWGGFSIVNATLLGMRIGLSLNRTIDYVINLSGTTYPLKSNHLIREKLAQHPNAIYMEIRPEPNFPPPEMWHHFIECDGALHRIARLTPARGMAMHMGSQWWMMPRHVAVWFLESSLPRQYATYAQHVVIADENYFATLLKNSPYCNDHVNSNYNFIQFDKWEHDREAARDELKCLQPDPNHCGRSPSTMTMGFKRLIEASTALFARKFHIRNPSSMRLLDEIDKMRHTQESVGILNGGGGGGGHHPSRPLRGDEGIKIMLWQKLLEQEQEELDEKTLDNSDTHNNLEQKDRTTASSSSTTSSANSTTGTTSSVMFINTCLEMPMAPTGGLLRSVPCDPSSPWQWFELGPCTGRYPITISDGQCTPNATSTTIKSVDTTDMDSECNDSENCHVNTTTTSAASCNTIMSNDSINPNNINHGLHSSSDGGSSSHYNHFDKDINDEDDATYCQLRSNGRNLCIDVSGENPYAGGIVIGYECTGRWNQLFRFQSDCSLMAVMPQSVGRVRGFEGQGDIALCLQSRPPTLTTGGGLEIITALCVNDKANTTAPTPITAAAAARHPSTIYESYENSHSSAASNHDNTEPFHNEQQQQQQQHTDYRKKIPQSMRFVPIRADGVIQYSLTSDSIRNKMTPITPV